MLHLIHQIWNSKDVASAILLAAIVAVACWIMALPFSSAVQEAYLKRFHLATPSFLAWSAQQTVPTMYNFENRYWVSKRPLTNDQTFGRDDRPTSGKTMAGFDSGMLNHFPTRKITFGDARSILNKDPNAYFYFSTKYRGREIQSSFRMKPISENEIQFEQMGWEIE
jgi:hypothetical protein